MKVTEANEEARDIFNNIQKVRNSLLDSQSQTWLVRAI
jgi:hypothetical protein